MTKEGPTKGERDALLDEFKDEAALVFGITYATNDEGKLGFRIRGIVRPEFARPEDEDDEISDELFLHYFLFGIMNISYTQMSSIANYGMSISMGEPLTNTIN